MHTRAHETPSASHALAPALDCTSAQSVTRAKRIMGRGTGGRVREGPGEGRETPSEGRNGHKRNESAPVRNQIERFRTRSTCPPRALSHNARASMRAVRARVRVKRGNLQ